MGLNLSPNACLVGLVLVFGATIVGSAYTYENVSSFTAIIGFGTMITVQLLGILKQDRASQKSQDTAVEVKQALNQNKAAIDTIANQTNGNLIQKLDAIHEGVTATKQTAEVIVQRVACDPPQ